MKVSAVVVASCIMRRTTLDIDSSVLRQAKRLAKVTGKSLSQVVSELAASAVSNREKAAPERSLVWESKAMHARIDLDDKEAVYAILDC